MTDPIQSKKLADDLSADAYALAQEWQGIYQACRREVTRCKLSIAGQSHKRRQLKREQHEN